MSEPISLYRRYRTKGSKTPVRILCVDNDHDTYPVVGAFNGIPRSWSADGRYNHGGTGPLDIEEIPEGES